jgi:streptogramin lyase
MTRWIVLSLFVMALGSRAAKAETITEFIIPTFGSYAQGITAGPDGSVWFTEANGNRIGRISPVGTLTEFVIPTNFSSPFGITASPDGNVWFTESNGNKIGRITPAGVITEFVVPTPGDPNGITVGPDGALWFTEVLGNKIGKMSTSGVFAEFPVPTPNAQPWAITTGPDGNLWFTEPPANKIGRITTTGVVTEFPIPTFDSYPNGITAGPDGNVWFTEVSASAIGRITPSGAIVELGVPVHAYDIITGLDGNLWFPQFATQGTIRVITPTFLTITEFPLPTPTSLPYGITNAPDGSVWFTEQGANRIGRIERAPRVGFFTLEPCRLADTRRPDGLLGGPALVAGAERVFTIIGNCAVPVTAKAVSVNLTVTAPTASGNLLLYPGGTTRPRVSTINYQPGQTRASNGIVTLGLGGDVTVYCGQGSGTAHFVLDVTGYFE